MELRSLVIQCAKASASLGLILAGLLLFAGHQREALGLLFGTAIGITNQIMLAVRVAGIGTYGGVRQTQMVMLAGTGMRFLVIGLATYITIRLSSALSLLGFTTGLLLTMAVGAVLGARWFLRGHS